MLMLARQPGAIFIGQGVKYDGVSLFADFEGIPDEQRIEFPVAEELQLGFGTGLAMLGYLPILVFPRCDFLLRALDQLVNHLDKLEGMSCGQWKPKVIIRTRVGPTEPLNAGPQHTANHAMAFRKMLTNIDVWEIKSPEDISLYWPIVEIGRSSLIVESL